MIRAYRLYTGPDGNSHVVRGSVGESKLVPTIKDARSNAQTLSAEDTIFANYFGLPAISVPCGLDSNRLPLGLQLVGKPRDEASVLQLAYQFERLNSGEIPR